MHMNSKIMRYRRGLSTVVVSAILLASISVIGTGLVSWSNTNLNAHKQNLQATFVTNMNKLNERINIENIWFGGITCSPLDKFVNMTMTNSGSIGLNITSIKFVNPSTGQTIQTWDITNGGVRTGETYTYQPDYCWTSGSAFNIVIDTERANIFQTQVTP